jgi:hypothetical protein
MPPSSTRNRKNVNQKRFLAQLFSSTHFSRYQSHLQKINHLTLKIARFPALTVEDR